MALLPPTHGFRVCYGSPFQPARSKEVQRSVHGILLQAELYEGHVFFAYPFHLARIQSNGYPSLRGKLWNIVNPGFQEEEEINCREYSHQASRGESSPVGEPKDWVFSPGDPLLRATGQVSHLKIRINHPCCFLHRVTKDQNQSEVSYVDMLCMQLSTQHGIVDKDLD